MKYTKENIMIFYIILIIILSAVGYYFGKVNYMIAGAVAGVIISAILWFTVGKNIVE